MNIDEKNKEIIKLLLENPNLTQKQIAEKIGLSQPSTYQRLKFLFETKTLSYNVVLDEKVRQEINYSEKVIEELKQEGCSQQ